jgi:NAD(P)-dependent dehydrogenase (short-subunit alcohol dehydrogenase family)
MGGIEGLVNSAGIARPAALDETSLGLWRSMIDVNLTGTFLTCREALPLLRSAEGAGIVNIASNQALRSEAMASAYAASKAGIVALTRSLAAELAPIRVNCICPGTIDTPMTRAGLGDDAPVINNLMRRRGTASEVASTIVHLLSPDASFVTGATWAIDGGRTFH